MLHVRSGASINLERNPGAVLTGYAMCGFPERTGPRERGAGLLLMPGLTGEGLLWLLERQEAIEEWLYEASAETRRVTQETVGHKLKELTGEDKARLDLLLRRFPK